MKNDFADWLSPMLVKELRQGVRSRLFISTFILLQAAMLLTLIVGLLNARAGALAENSATGSTVTFWLLVGISVLVILPMSGINAIGAEIKANTLELILLTRLSSLRIVAGKWLAIFASSVLLVTAVLPYLVLRYFLGAVNITTELIVLFSMLAASAWLTAITVGVSAYRTGAARWVIGFIFFFGLQGSMPFVFLGGRLLPMGGFGVFSHWQLAWLMVSGAIFLLLMLDVGAAKIAPPAENHSAIQRALMLGLLAVAALANASPGDAHGVTILAFVLTWVVCAAALCEQPRWIGSIHRPFAARGLAGRLLGRLLYPGWHTGVWYATVMFAGFAALMWHLKMLDTFPAILRLVAAFGALLLPVALTRQFLPQTQRPLVLFFVMQIVCLILSVVLLIVDEALKTSFKNFIAFLPVCSLIQSADDSKPFSTVSAMGVMLVTAASWLVLLLLRRAPLKRTRQLEIDSLQNPAVP